MLGLTLAVALFCAPAALAEDTTPPTLVSTTVNVATVTMTFSEALDETSVPGVNAFRVNAWGARPQYLLSPAAVAISGSKVILTVHEPVTEQHGLNAYYRRPGSGSKLRDLAHNEVEDTQFLPADNLTPPEPVVMRARTAADGSAVVITFSEVLHQSTKPADSAWTVTVDGAERPVSGSAISGSAVRLLLASMVTEGQAVSVSYAKPDSGGLRDPSGNAAESFTGQTVRNTVRPPSGPPTDVTVTGATAGSLSVSWRAPAESTVTDYDIRYFAGSADPADDADWIEAGEPGGHDHTGTATTAVIDGLTASTAYRVQVRAANGASVGPWSASASRTTAPPVPGVPTGVMVTGATWNSLSASWTAPTGSTVTGYDIRYYAGSADPANDADWIEAGEPGGHDHTGTATAAVIGGLRASTAYRVQVRAVNGASAGPWSASAGRATAPPRPGAPTIVMVVGATWNTLSVSWAVRPGTAVTDYDVRYYAGSADPADEADWIEPGEPGGHDHTGAATGTVIGGLTASTAYRVQVRAVNGASVGPWSASAVRATAVPPPGVPTGVTVTEASRNSLSVSWTAPTGSTVTDYDIRYYAGSADPANAADWIEPGEPGGHNHTGTATAAVIRGLRGGTAYRVQVRAVNGSGGGAWSTSAGRATAPRQPRYVTVTGATRNSLSVSWTAPGGSAVTDYDIRYYAGNADPANEADWIEPSEPGGHDHAGTATTAVIGGLRANTAYRVQVRAVNESGAGQWSASAGRTTAPPPTVVRVTLKGATVTMYFDDTLDSESVPDPSAFHVNVFGYPILGIIHPAEVAISGSAVTLTLAAPVRESQGVDLNYLWRPGAGSKLRDLAGNELEATHLWLAQRLDDTTPPVPVAAETSSYGWEVVVVFREAGVLLKGPSTSWWHGVAPAITVTVDGEPATITYTGRGTAPREWWHLKLRLSQPIQHGQTVEVSYDKTELANPAHRLADTYGNEVASFGPMSVKNTGPPSPRLDRMPEVNARVLTLTFDKRLDATSTPAPGDFAVQVWDLAGPPRGISSVVVDGYTVMLTLASAALRRQAVVVSYTKGVNPIRDKDGNEATNLVDHWVRNVTPWTLEGQVTGRSLSMTFEAELDPESRPSGQAFTVTATPPGGSPRTISGTDSARIAGRSVTVPLASAIAIGESASVSYTRPSEGAALRAANGDEVPDFSGKSIVNEAPDEDAPAVTQVEVASDAGEDGTYAVGETVRMRLTFDTAVDVAGAPRLKLDMSPADGDERWAVYESGGGTAQLSFAYAVAEGDASAEGVAVLADTLELDGGTIAAAGGTAGAVLSHAGLAADPDHRVDGIRPRVAAAAIDGKELTVTFDEELAPAMQAPERTALLYRFVVNGTGVEQSLRRVAVDGRVVTLGLGMAAEAGQKVMLSYNPGSGGDRLRDAAGNLVAAFTDTPVTNAPASGAAPLTASFVGMPGGHDGRTAFGFELRFSENFPGRLDYKVLKDHALQVTNGRAIGVRRAAPNQNQRWTITVRPWSSEEVTVTLAATADCSAGAAVCTPDGRALSNSPSATVSGPGADQPAANTPATGAPTIAGTAQVGETLTASTAEIADADGLTGAAFAWQWLSNDAAITGATGASYTLADADVGRTIKVRVTFTDDAGHAETLISAATAAVASRPLTASFVGVPAEHDGRTAFSFELRFSENFPGRLSYKVFKDHALQVTNGRAVGVRRAAPGQNQRWTITVRPWSVADVTVTLPAAGDCAAPGSVCTEAGRKLANTVTAQVLGPPLVSVADAEAREGTDEAAAFAVTLNRAASGTVTVDYATADGTAVAGEDYTATSGTLTFAVGEREKTVAVRILDDEHDEGRKTFRLVLSNADGAHIADGEAGIMGADGTQLEDFTDVPVRNDAPAAVEAVAVASEAGADGAYTEGERIEAAVTFSAPVRVATDDGTPTLALIVDGTIRRAAYVSGSGTASLVFAYPVSEADGALRAVRVAASGLKLNGGAIAGAADGTPALLAFGDAPGVTGVTIAAEEDAVWDAGDTVAVTLRFAEPVTVAGAPSVGLALGSGERRAPYLRGSGSDALVFGYTLAEGDGATGAVQVPGDSLDLGGGSIVSAGGGLAAELSHDAAALALAPPPVAARFVSATVPAHGNGVVLTFSKNIASGGAHTAYAVTVGGAARGTRGSFWEDDTVGLVLSEPVRAGETVAVSYAKPGSVFVAALLDVDGLAVASFGPEAVENTVPEVAPGPAPLTAAFVGVPAEHDGRTAFSFELRFSEDFPGRLSYKVLKDHALQVTNGRAIGVKRAAPHQNQRWTITVRPWSVEDVTVTLPAAVDCAAAGSVCTEAGRKLANTVTARVLGPALVSVADAEAREGVDQEVAFPVTLSRAASGTVTVDYASADGTAVAGEDYTATSGTLTFAVGEREKTVAVAVLDDDHDEGRETFTLVLSNANGAHIADGEAVGTILNADEMPKAWLARFGRTVAEQVLAGVEARLAAPRAAGGRARVAGRRSAAPTRRPWRGWRPRRWRGGSRVPRPRSTARGRRAGRGCWPAARSR